MVHSQLRRALAALVLAALVALTPASAATRAQGERARTHSVRTHGSWLARAVTSALEKAGLRIDPNGIW